ncbi:MAG: DUF58 domain-containing protein [Opitutaceae bacterium]
MPAPFPTRSGRSLDPETLLAIRDLELRARVVVEGLWAGLHRSPFSGFSVEFSEYRQYVAGDDLRYLDWRVLARTDREYVRKFEDETNLRCQLLVDHSRSMEFGSRGHTKAEYARTLAASLAYFLLQQRDMVGVALFADGLAAHLPARWRPGHLQRLLAALDQAPAGSSTGLGSALADAARLWRKRGVAVIISDLLAPVDTWDDALGHLVAIGHDVRVIQILDPAELTLDFGRVAEWEDLESGRRLHVDPSRAASGFRDRIQAHFRAVESSLDARGVPLQRVKTDQPLDLVLMEWLRAVSRSRASISRKGGVRR